MKQVKIGLLGVGHLGKIHLKCLKNTPFHIVGFYDSNMDQAQAVSEEMGIPCFETIEALMREVDALDIVTPTITHFDLAKKAIEQDLHVFIEKPVTNTLEEAKALYELNLEKNKVVQVGHVERYNPAILSLQKTSLAPAFIEGHRLAMFNPRGTDVSVVLDLMIHDLDLVLSIVRSPVQSVMANGVNVVSKKADICNARIQFENGCVANLTASRISLKNMRKLRLFQGDAYISLDFLKKESQVVRLEEVPEGIDADTINGMTLSTDTGTKRISIEMPEMIENNAIQSELTDFYNSIVEGKEVTVPLRDGYMALQLAHQIEDQLSTKA
jgi:predicted dehydrogenase